MVFRLPYNWFISFEKSLVFLVSVFAGLETLVNTALGATLAVISGVQLGVRLGLTYQSDAVQCSPEQCLMRLI